MQTSHILRIDVYIDGEFYMFWKHITVSCRLVVDDIVECHPLDSTEGIVLIEYDTEKNRFIYDFEGVGSMETSVMLDRLDYIFDGGWNCTQDLMPDEGIVYSKEQLRTKLLERNQCNNLNNQSATNS